MELAGQLFLETRMYNNLNMNDLFEYLHICIWRGVGWVAEDMIDKSDVAGEG